jgi:hypothetical protein
VRQCLKLSVLPWGLVYFHLLLAVVVEPLVRLRRELLGAADAGGRW